jgi:hypothetical protein
MPVLKNVSVIEAANERIKVVDEDIVKVAKELTGANLRSAARAAGRGGAIFLATLLMLAGLSCIAVGSAVRGDGTGFVGFGVVLIGTGVIILVASRKKEEDLSTVALQRRLDELRAHKGKLEQEKREMLLGYEREIKQETEEVVAFDIEDELSKSDEKVCPQCAETVKAKAKICRFCRYDFSLEKTG